VQERSARSARLGASAHVPAPKAPISYFREEQGAPAAHQEAQSQEAILAPMARGFPWSRFRSLSPEREGKRGEGSPFQRRAGASFGGSCAL